MYAGLPRHGIPDRLGSYAFPRALTKCCVTPALGNSLWNLSHTEELTPSSTCMVKQEQNHSCTINDDESKAQLLNEYFVKNLTIPESQMDS